MTMLQEAATVGGVKRLAIVDDAYDPPAGEEILEQAFNQFVQRVEDDEILRAEFELKSHLTAADIDDWETFQQKEELVDALWALYVGTSDQPPATNAADEALKVLFGDVEADRITKLTQLRPLENMLGALEDVKLLKLGSGTDPKTIATVDVIFLDLFLSSEVPAVAGNPKPSQTALDKARARALRYLNEVKDATKDDVSKIPPAFVLISSIATSVIGANFRKSARQAVSRYRFVQKDAIERGEYGPMLAIADILRTSKASSVVEPLIRAWPDILKEASTWVGERIELLDTADFGRLHSMSLNKEGQPVEEYLKELLAGALAERVANAFTRKAPAKAGSSPFSDMRGEYFDPPSSAFAELYGATRVSSDPGFRGVDGTNPISGDLYFEGKLPKSARTHIGRSILTVMSPICDLVDRGDGAPAAKSVLLLRGTLAHSQKQKSESNPLVIGSRLYEIDWDLRFPQALPIKDFKTKIKDKDLTWLGRLRQEHFLSLQSRYLSALGRIGVLKAPMHFEALAGRVVIREADAIASVGITFQPKDQLAFLTREQDKEPDKQPVFFSGEFVGMFLKQLTALNADATRPASTRSKAKTLLENLSRVISLQKSQAVGQHRFNENLSVMLAANSTTDPAPGPAIQILVWRV